MIRAARRIVRYARVQGYAGGRPDILCRGSDHDLVAAGGNAPAVRCAAPGCQQTRIDIYRDARRACRLQIDLPPAGETFRSLPSAAGVADINLSDFLAFGGTDVLDIERRSDRAIVGGDLEARVGEARVCQAMAEREQGLALTAVIPLVADRGTFGVGRRERLLLRQLR